MEKQRQKQRKYSTEFKINVIIEMRKQKMSYHEAVRAFELGDANAGGARAMLQRWERIYLEEGAEGLMKERRGRKSMPGENARGRKPNFDPNVEEDLIAENQRLRMEIEYLKKLSALVLAEEQKSGKKRS